MSGRPIPIFYEDDWGSVKEFGLHELLVACVADQLGQDWWSLRGRFDAIPKKGDSKLLAACENDVPDMPDRTIIAVFDADKLHKLLFGSGRPSNDEIHAALRRRCTDERLHVFLLDRNTETVVDAVADCLKVERPRKNPLLRDQLLLRAARSPTTEVRDCVRRAVPSFEQCVCAIASLT